LAVVFQQQNVVLQEPVLQRFEVPQPRVLLQQPLVQLEPEEEEPLELVLELPHPVAMAKVSMMARKMPTLVSRKYLIFHLLLAAAP
jgi:hypothetical protein